MFEFRSQFFRGNSKYPSFLRFRILVFSVSVILTNFEPFEVLHFDKSVNYTCSHTFFIDLKMNVLNPHVHGYNEITWTYPKPPASYKTLQLCACNFKYTKSYLQGLIHFQLAHAAKNASRNHKYSFEKSISNLSWKIHWETPEGNFM